MHNVAFAGVLCAVLAVTSAASAQQVSANVANGEVDPTQEPTIDLQQEEEAQTAGTGFSVHGVTYLQYNAPLYEMGGFNLLLSQIEMKYDAGAWGAYATPRLKVADLNRPVEQGTLYFQQAYGYARHTLGEVKVGKVYGRFGRFWDFGFYGPLMANNDLKLTPDLGISAEGAPTLVGALNLEYAVQYFAADGRTLALRNASVMSFDAARRRNILTVRAAPTWHFNSESWASVGISGQRFDSASTDNHRVIRGAVDANGAYGPLSTFVELGRQQGGDVVAAHNQAIASHSYLWTGAELKLGRVGMRYHFNAIRYEDTAATVETLQQPGIEVAVNDYVGLMGEMALWNTNNATTGRGEKSFYVIANGKF